jgi:hypothetical protein
MGSLHRQLLLLLSMWLRLSVVMANDNPVQMLDERTGATIVTAGRPLVFVRQLTAATDEIPCYVTLTAANIDKSGSLKNVFLAYFWCAGPMPRTEISPGQQPIILATERGTVTLSPDALTLLEEGISDPPNRPPFGRAASYVYPASLQTMRDLADPGHLVLISVAQKYELFEDRRDALRRFVQSLSKAAQE